MDSMTFDVTQNPWRRGEILDAIVTGQLAFVPSNRECGIVNR